ncbi:Rv1157c family protein [Corynebacterium casei]|uniref:Rv1157c family protein n=1 Tax=Corynebacterium casei TaxID=160386 RepID=UPI003F9013C9
MSKNRRLAFAAALAAALLGIATPAIAQSSAGSSAGVSQVASSSGVENPLDELGRPTAATQAQVRDFANQPWMPREARNAILSALAFYAGEGDGESGVPLVEGGPNFEQFYWPTVSGKCIGGQGDSVGSAIAVPGPTEIPAPGAKSGETAFVFTALGTEPAAQRQGDMHVQWFNIDTFKTGITPLSNNGINSDGPATVSGTASTGKGTIVAVVSGTVKTQEQPCSFVPTAAIFEVK